MGMAFEIEIGLKLVCAVLKNSLLLSYGDQSVNVVRGNNSHLFLESYKTLCVWGGGCRAFKGGFLEMLPFFMGVRGCLMLSWIF
jgi:hypothetical protein